MMRNQMPFKRPAQALSIILIVLSIISCSTEARFEKRYSSWIGSSIYSLVDAWGEPQIILEKQDQTIEYGYNLSLSKKKQLPDTCIIFFQFRKSDNTIIGIRHEGDRCKMAPSFV